MSDSAWLHGDVRNVLLADANESVATIHAALDAGVTLLDTGDFYGAGHNEMLIGPALKDRRDKAVLSVKFGALRSPDGAWIGLDTVRNFAAYSLKDRQQPRREWRRGSTPTSSWLYATDLQPGFAPRHRFRTQKNVISAH